MVAKLKVLCVDDNPDAVQSVGDLLHLAGCQVMGCQDGATALSVAEDFGPDVCLLDLTMPGMDGLELATRLRDLAGDRPVRLVALTGRWDPDSHHATHNLRFDRHLVKPCDPRRLVEAVTGR